LNEKEKQLILMREKTLESFERFTDLSNKMMDNSIESNEKILKLNCIVNENQTKLLNSNKSIANLKEIINRLLEMLAEIYDNFQK